MQDLCTEVTYAVNVVRVRLLEFDGHVSFALMSTCVVTAMEVTSTLPHTNFFVLTGSLLMGKSFLLHL